MDFDELVDDCSHLSDGEAYLSDENKLVCYCRAYIGSLRYEIIRIEETNNNNFRVTIPDKEELLLKPLQAFSFMMYLLNNACWYESVYTCTSYDDATNAILEYYHYIKVVYDYFKEIDA